MSRSVLWDQKLDGSGPDALSTIDGILKEDYVRNRIINTVNMATYLLSRLQEKRTTAGRRYVFPVKFGVGEGQGNRGENEDLPDPGFGEYDQAMGIVRFQYGSMYISGPAIEATEGNRAAFASALKQALQDVRDGFKLDTQRQTWGDGTGTIAKVDGAHNAQTVIAVKDPYGYSYDSAALDDSQKVRPFRRNMKVYFKTADASRKVTKVNGDGTIEVDSAITLVDDELIIRGDASGKTNEGREFQGVGKSVADTGTYLGIPRSGLPEWQANVIDMNGNDLDEDIIQVAFDTAEINGTEEPDTLISEHVVRRLYVALLQSQKRFVNTLDLKGGFKGLDYNGQPWVVDKNCPPQRLYYLRLANFCWYVMKQIGWLNRDGTILKWVDGKDAYRAVLATYRDIVCEQPNNQTVLINVVS